MPPAVASMNNKLRANATRFGAGPTSTFSKHPILLIATYQEETYFDGSAVAVCFTAADTPWSAAYFVGCIALFFLLPFVILVALYAVIARQLLERSPALQRPTTPPPPQPPPSDVPPIRCQLPMPTPMQQPGSTNAQLRSNVHRYRKQVIFMLVAVVASFFLCLLPFRAFTLWIIVMPPETIVALGIEGYYNLLYFSRIMLYFNSALNPILYNLMSSKFRTGFCQLMLRCVGRGTHVHYKNGRGIINRHGREALTQRGCCTKRGLTREGTIFTNSISTSSSNTQRTYLRNSSITTSSGEDTAKNSSAKIVQPADVGKRKNSTIA